MNYKVHHLDAKEDNIDFILEQYLNNLAGEVISVFPHLKPTFQLMGATAKIDYLIIIEKLN